MRGREQPREKSHEHDKALRTAEPLGDNAPSSWHAALREGGQILDHVVPRAAKVPARASRSMAFPVAGNLQGKSGRQIKDRLTDQQNVFVFLRNFLPFP